MACTAPTFRASGSFVCGLINAAIVLALIVTAALSLGLVGMVHRDAHARTPARTSTARTERPPPKRRPSKWPRPWPGSKRQP